MNEQIIKVLQDAVSRAEVARQKIHHRINALEAEVVDMKKAVTTDIGLTLDERIRDAVARIEILEGKVVTRTGLTVAESLEHLEQRAFEYANAAPEGVTLKWLHDAVANIRDRLSYIEKRPTMPQPPFKESDDVLAMANDLRNRIAVTEKELDAVRMNHAARLTLLESKAKAPIVLDDSKAPPLHPLAEAGFDSHGNIYVSSECEQVGAKMPDWAQKIAAGPTPISGGRQQVGAEPKDMAEGALKTLTNPGPDARAFVEECDAARPANLHPRKDGTRTIEIYNSYNKLVGVIKTDDDGWRCLDDPEDTYVGLGADQYGNERMRIVFRSK